MRKYCLSVDESANLSEEYDSELLDFAYGLRLLQACISNADEVYGGRSNYEEFSIWLSDLSALVDEGFEYLERAAHTDESDEAAAEKVDDDDWDAGASVGKVTVSQLSDLMSELAESIEFALTDSPEAACGPEMNDEEYERLDEEVASVAGRVRDVGLEACGFLIRAQFIHSTGSKESAPKEPIFQIVECMFDTRS